MLKMNATAALKTRKSYTSIFKQDFSNNFIALSNNTFLNIFSTIFSLRLNEDWRCFVNNSTFFSIELVNFDFLKLRNVGRSCVKTIIIEKINDAIDWSILFLLSRKKMTEMNIKIVNLNIVIFKEIEIFVSTIIILLTITDEFFIKSSSKEMFV